MDSIDLLSAESLTELYQMLEQWLVEYVLIASTGVQVAILGFTLAIVSFATPTVQRFFIQIQNPWLKKISSQIFTLTRPILWLILMWATLLVGNLMEQRLQFINIVASLTAAWIIIKLASRIVQQPAMARFIAWLAWIVAALNILDLLNPVIEILDSRSVTFGEIRISPYTIITTTLALTILLWVAVVSSRFFEQRIRTTSSLSPSVQVLLTKSFTFVLMGLAVLVSLQSVGIDLTALAVLGGALGLGIGFGLQRIVANLISGVILLLDKSIKPGDVIAVDQTYGWVNALGARYVSVITRDGIEHLIPNETLIVEQVENWTHSNRKRRLKLPLGIHYDSDLEEAIKVCIEATNGTDRVIEDPPVNCLITEFGDSSINLEVRFWIEDAQNGIANVKSAVYMKIWKAFKAHGIEIPYPQRDLHIRSANKDLNLLATEAD